MNGARPFSDRASTGVCAAVLAFAVAACPPGAAKAEDFGEGRIAGDRVNVRAAAHGEAQTLGQLSSGDGVRLAGAVSEPWVKIRLPEAFSAWIYSPLVGKDDEGRSVVAVQRAQLRAGPGLNHASLGFGLRGQVLEVRGRSGDWTKISPKGLDVFAFVTNAYVKAAPPPAPPRPKAEPAPVTAPPPPPPPPPKAEPVPVAAVSAPVAPPVPSEEPAAAPKLVEAIATAAPERSPGAGRDVVAVSPSAKPRRTLLSTDQPTPVGPAGIPSTRLRSDVAQARSGSYAGTLARSPSLGSHPTRWRLVVFSGTDQARPQTVCYVYGNDAQLSGLCNRALVVSGAVYHYRGTRLPTIFAQDIVIER